jgi:hypothetical protein
MAAGALADLGTNLVSQGGARQGAAGSLYSNLLGQGVHNREYARGEGEKAGTGIGSFLRDALGGLLGGKSRGFKLPTSTMGTEGIPGMPRIPGPF